MRRRSPFRAAARDPLIERAVPVTAHLARYRGPTARRDVLAGVTVAALALPAAMAYGEVAGVSPVNGLYALLLLVGAIALVALFAGRRLLPRLPVALAVVVAALIASSALDLEAAGVATVGAIPSGLENLVFRRRRCRMSRRSSRPRSGSSS